MDKEIIEEEVEGDDACPNCGCEYDDIDYEYQICHLCGFNNNKNNNGEKIGYNFPESK